MMVVLSNVNSIKNGCDDAAEKKRESVIKSKIIHHFPPKPHQLQLEKIGMRDEVASDDIGTLAQF